MPTIITHSEGQEINHPMMLSFHLFISKATFTILTIPTPLCSHPTINIVYPPTTALTY